MRDSGLKTNLLGVTMAIRDETTAFDTGSRLREAVRLDPRTYMSTTTTQQARPRLHSLVHFEIPASDPVKNSRFYERLFGWKFAKWGDQEYWLISHKDATDQNDTMGGLFKRNNSNEGFLNYFSVQSIDESVAKAKSAGASVVTPKQEIPTIGHFAVLKDPDGNTFALFESSGRM